MDTQLIISQLEQEWELETGFLGRLRRGVFDPVGFERLERILQSVEIGDTPMLPRRFVSLTWYIPLFMEWQQDLVPEERRRRRAVGGRYEQDTGVAREDSRHPIEPEGADLVLMLLG